MRYLWVIGLLLGLGLAQMIGKPTVNFLEADGVKFTYETLETVESQACQTNLANFRIALKDEAKVLRGTCYIILLKGLKSLQPGYVPSNKMDLAPVNDLGRALAARGFQKSFENFDKEKRTMFQIWKNNKGEGLVLYYQLNSGAVPDAVELTSVRVTFVKK